MAEIVQKVQDLTSLPLETHWFCPRCREDEHGAYFDEDCLGSVAVETPEAKAARSLSIDEARSRTTLVLEACTIFAFDGPEAQEYQAQLRKGLQVQLTRCDVCVREYHRSRAQLRTMLDALYDGNQVEEFMRRFDDMNIARINVGLDSATDMLHDLPPDMRNIAAAGETGMYALFEALNCWPYLLDEESLKDHFDKPFSLVQSKKKIKLPSYAPGMVSFLYSSNNDRSTWAFKNLSGIKRSLCSTEFDFAVKPALEKAMRFVNISMLDAKFLPKFWQATTLLLQKMTKDLVANNLRSMDANIYRVSLEHFQVPSTHLGDLTKAYQILLELNPHVFWEAMGDVTSKQLVEQIFKAPSLEHMMTTTEETEPLKLEEKLAWIAPFLRSVKPANIVEPVRVLLQQLLKRCQEKRYSLYARDMTYEFGLNALVTALAILREHVRGGPVLTNMIELVSDEHIATIMEALDGIENLDEMHAIDPAKTQALLIIQHLLAIDLQNLTFDQATILQTRKVDYELGISSLRCWKMCMRAIRAGHGTLVLAILTGLQGLLPLETFASRQVQAAPLQAKNWNSALAKVVNHTNDDFLERLQSFAPDQVVEIFADQDGANGIMSLILNGDDQIHYKAMSLLKTLTGEDSRRDSLRHVVVNFPGHTLRAISSAAAAICKARAFTPIRTALKICTDVFSCLCDSSDGVLRSGKQLSENDLDALKAYWDVTWRTLGVIFENTEHWSNLGYEKQVMQTFCRETMDFADFAFDQYAVISSALQQKKNDSSSNLGRLLLVPPKNAFAAIVRWLRLRDDYLVDKAVSLTTKMLLRLHEVGITAAIHAREIIENVLVDRTKTRLSMNQKAGLQRAYETHFDVPAMPTEVIDLDADPVTALKQGSLQDWASASSSRSATPVGKVKKSGGIDFDAWNKNKASTDVQNETRKMMAEIAPTSEAFKKRQEAARAKLGKPAIGPATVRGAQQSNTDFLAKRKKEKEEAEKRRAAAVAGAKGVGIGSGVSGLGDLGKDHTMKGQAVFASSDESSSDDEDDELFGGKVKGKVSRGAPDVNPHGAVGLKPEQKAGPTRIHRTARSMKDMRARLAPDLGPLHREILKWDFFHDGDYPPGSSDHQFERVTNSYSNSTSYQSAFQPLLTLEAWQQMVKAREENQDKPYEIKVISRSNVDNFIEISSPISKIENRELSLQEGDIILLSTSKNPTSAPDAPNCLARIFRIKRQKVLEIVYRLVGGTLAPALQMPAVVFGVKVQSITPLEREYGALQGLQYYDLCNQITMAKPSPRNTYSEKQVAALQDVYNVNAAQSEAINAALSNDGFSLIQGPPGSGKTKTIVAIVGGLLSSSLGSASSNGTTRVAVPGQKPVVDSGGASKKLMVCAPSNAAVDEIVMRLKNGVKTKTGRQHAINIVRIGRSDAINSNVQDVTMDELVAKHLGGSGDDQKQRQKNELLYKEHQKVSAELRDLYEQRDSGKVEGKAQKDLLETIVSVRRRKNELGMSIDASKDQEKSAGREAELSKKRAQQAVLDKAHVICATLSGSGHDMFQNLNIEFETVIIDEAAQCVEMSSLIPLKYGCIKCIMVGDPKQLPPTVFSKEAARFQYEQSLFVRMQNNFADRVHLLDTQYRMHPDISIFPSRTFYDSLLRDGDGMAGLRQKPWHSSSLLAPYRFYDVKGQHSAAPKGHSLINIAEIDVAIALYSRLLTDFDNYDFSGRIGIITPYKSQLRALKDRFSSRFGNEVLDSVEFNTTDAFQGRESEIIIFSCVRASPGGGIGFLQDIRRMNVGLTRAKSSLWVLGNSESLSRGQYWRKLVDDARARDSLIGGNLLQMLQKESSAYPADSVKTVSMHDVPAPRSSTQQQQLPGSTSRVPPVNGAHVPHTAVAPTIPHVNGSHPPRPHTNGSHMEGVTYKYEDRVAAANTKKRPALDNDQPSSKPRIDASGDVDMVDAEPPRESTRSFPAQLDGAMSRAETPLSGGEMAKPTPKIEKGVTKKANVVAPAPQPIMRKKKAADPFMPKKR
ncbi:DEAD-box type RNA helicase [Oleoguttula sp. CCFEE 5521]